MKYRTKRVPNAKSLKLATRIKLDPNPWKYDTVHNKTAAILPIPPIKINSLLRRGLLMLHIYPKPIMRIKINIRVTMDWIAGDDKIISSSLL
jgi:hypothetical protein